MNNCTFIGRMTKDPVKKIVPINGVETSVLNFYIAVDDGFGDYKKTDFIHVTAWRGAADAIAQYMTKGSEIAIKGRRGFFASFQYVTLIGGQLLASLVLIILQSVLTAQQLTANKTVAQVVLGALTMDARCMAPADANIVEHGSFLDELCLDGQLRMSLADEQAAVGHLPRMFQ